LNKNPVLNLNLNECSTNAEYNKYNLEYFNDDLNEKSKEKLDKSNVDDILDEEYANNKKKELSRFRTSNSLLEKETIHINKKNYYNFGYDSRHNSLRASNNDISKSIDQE